MRARANEDAFDNGVIVLIVDDFETGLVVPCLAQISHNQVENDVFHGMRWVRGMECRVASSKRLRRAGMRVFSTPFCGRDGESLVVYKFVCKNEKRTVTTDEWLESDVSSGMWRCLDAHKGRPGANHS